MTPGPGLWRAAVPERWGLIAGLTFVALFVACPGWAEKISGTVLDPSGAVVPGAAVTIRNSEIGIEQRFTTDNAGSFACEALPMGRYEIAVHAPGFRPYLQIVELGGVALVLTATLAINSEMTTIEVSADSPQIETSSAALGEFISDATMAGVPLNGRSFTDLLALQAGVNPASSQQPNAVLMSGCASTSPSGDLSPGTISVSGQRETANGFVVNGSAVEEAFSMGTAVVPNLDSIQEFRVLTSSFEAEYGNYPGGQVLVTTKSGADHLHGSIFEFLRNTALDARNYFSRDRAHYDQNQFGGTLGGPIRKDSVFFFADYQGTRLTKGIDTGILTVPSIEDRSGNLADLASHLTGLVEGAARAQSLSRVLGYNVHVGEPYFSPGCTTTNQCVFPNAVIPQRVWSGPARALLGYIPLPNGGAHDFSTSSEAETLRDDKAALRLDAHTRWGALSAYYFLDDYSMNNPYPRSQGGANVPGFNALTSGRSQLFSLSLKTSGAKTVNEFHFSYTRDSNVVGQPQRGVGPSLASQGFLDPSGHPSIVALAPQIEGIENVALNDVVIGVTTTGLTQANNTYQWSDDFMKLAGRHMLKFGGALHIDQINIHPDAIYNGSFTFTGSATGSDFADFLLGYPSTYSQGDSNPFYLRNRYIGLYGQDTWRLKRNLTLSYGLRWDVLPPWREKQNQLQTLVPGAQSVVYPGAPRGLLFPGDPGIPDTLAPTRYTNIAPRLGLVYSPGFQDGLLGKIFGGPGLSSIRAAYGIFYGGFEGLSAGIMSANPPYGYDYTSLAPPTFADPFVDAATGERVPQPFPEPIPAYGATALRPNSGINWSQYLPITGVPSFYRGNVSPYTESYTVAIERQLSPSTVLGIAYVGNQGHHLLVLVSANPGSPQACLATPGCGPFAERATRGPFDPTYFDAVTYQKTIGNSHYNALQLTLRHRSGPLEMLLGYTYSKSIDQSSSLAEPVDPIDPRRSSAPSAFDLRHNLVLSYRLELPLAQLLHHRNGWTRGWFLSGITRLSSGFPVTLYNNTDSSLLGTIPNGINNNGTDTLQVAPGDPQLNRDPRRSPYAFNTSLFSVPPLGMEGNGRRRMFYGPGIANFDMALQKVVRLSQSKSLELRLEAFNVFNHAQFFGPATVNGNISSANFGRIVSADAPRQVQLLAKIRL